MTMITMMVMLGTDLMCQLSKFAACDTPWRVRAQQRQVALQVVLEVLKEARGGAGDGHDLAQRLRQPALAVHGIGALRVHRQLHGGQRAAQVALLPTLLHHLGVHLPLLYALLHLDLRTRHHCPVAAPNSCSHLVHFLRWAMSESCWRKPPRLPWLS